MIKLLEYQEAVNMLDVDVFDRNDITPSRSAGLQTGREPLQGQIDDLRRAVIKTSRAEAAVNADFTTMLEKLLAFAESLQNETDATARFAELQATLDKANTAVDVINGIINTTQSLIEQALLAIDTVNAWKDSVTDALDSIPVVGGWIAAGVDLVAAALETVGNLIGEGAALLTTVAGFMETVTTVVKTMTKLASKILTIVGTISDAADTARAIMAEDDVLKEALVESSADMQHTISTTMQALSTTGRQRTPRVLVFQRPLFRGRVGQTLSEMTNAILARLERIPAHSYLMGTWPVDDTTAVWCTISIGDNYSIGIQTVIDELMKKDGVRIVDLYRLCLNKSMYYVEWGTATWDGTTWSKSGLVYTNKGDERTTGIAESRIVSEGSVVASFAPRVTGADAIHAALTMADIADDCVRRNGSKSPHKYCLLSKKGIGGNCQTITKQWRTYLEDGGPAPWNSRVSARDGGKMLVRHGGDWGIITSRLNTRFVHRWMLPMLRTSVAVLNSGSVLSADGTVYNTVTSYAPTATFDAIRTQTLTFMTSAVDTRLTLARDASSHDTLVVITSPSAGLNEYLLQEHGPYRYPLQRGIMLGA
jgi:methyl-accepting chemotaxis protein